MRVALLFPPGTDPRNPHLSLPSLAAVLRQAGVHTTVRDLDLEGVLALTTQDAILAAASTCARRLDRPRDSTDRARLRRALSDADLVAENVAGALLTLRDPVRFYDPYLYYAARECMARALELVSAAVPGVHYNIGPVQYDVDGVDPSRLSDLDAVTRDDRWNLFAEYHLETVFPQLDRERPDLVGISILNQQQVLPGLMLARSLKDRGHFVVIGGTVYTKFVDALRDRPAFFRLFCDGLIPYEGATALLALLEQLAGARELTRVPNFLHLDGTGRVAMGRYHVEDVNRLPTPDFDGLPLDQYLAPAPVLPLETGRGCYFNRCKFCDIPYINRIATKSYRIRSPELIAGDVARLFERHGARHFEITDEALAPKLLLRLGDALTSYPHVQPRFVGFARLERGFTAETCRRLFDIGFRKLFFGLESGSQATLDHMDKGIRLEDARDVLTHCADAGIAFHVFSMIGFPEETEPRARETLAFLLENSAVLGRPENSFDVHRFSLDLRTTYGDQPARYGIEIDERDLAARDFPIAVERWRNGRGLPDETVERLLAEFYAALREAFRPYHLYPRHLWPDWATYALLYADHYANAPFPFRLTLPPPEDLTPLRLTWSEDVRVTGAPGGYSVRCMGGEGEVSSAALHLLARPLQPLPAGELLGTLAAMDEASAGRDAAVGALRDVIDELVGIGALRIELSPGSMPDATPPVQGRAVAAALAEVAAQ